MTGHGGGSRGGSRARRPVRATPQGRGPARPQGRGQGTPQGRGPVKETPLVAFGQIVLGLSLSCLIAVLIGCAIVGVVFAVAYMLK